MTTIQTSSIPDAIDYIIALVRALNLKSGTGEPIYVYDGLPDRPDNPPDDFVAIGGATQRIAADRGSWPNLGGPSMVPDRDENYDIDCYVSCYRGGQNSPEALAGSSDAQKTARDAAFTIYRALETALRADIKLGGIITTGWSSFGDITEMSQTAYGDSEASMGRSCTLMFSVSVFRRKRAV